MKKIQKNDKYKFVIHSYVYPTDLEKKVDLKSIHRTCSGGIPYL